MHTSAFLRLLITSSVALSAALSPAWSEDLPDPNTAVGKAALEFKAGHYDQAVLLLIHDIKDNGGSGESHRYLIEALKKLGKSEETANQLETAIKACPAPLIDTVAK